MKRFIHIFVFSLICLVGNAQTLSPAYAAGIQAFNNKEYNVALACFERGIHEYENKTKDSVYVEHLHYKYLCQAWLERWDDSKQTMKKAVDEYDKLGHTNDMLGCILARDLAEILYNGDKAEKQQFFTLMKRYVNGLEKGVLTPSHGRWIPFYVAGRFANSVFWEHEGEFPERKMEDENTMFKKRCLYYAYKGACESLQSGNIKQDQWESVSLDYAKYSCQAETECVDIIKKVIESRRKRLRPNEFYLYAETFIALSYFLLDSEFLKVVKYEKFVSYGKQYGKQLEVYFDYILAQHYNDIEHYRTALKGFEETCYEGNEINMYYCAQELADLYEESRQYSSAAYYYEKALSLMNRHWKEWGKSSKYAKCHKHAANNGKLELYYDLCQVYKEAKMYSRIVDLSEKVLSDPELEFDNNLKRYVYAHISEAKELMGDYSGHRETKSEIDKNDNSDSSSNAISLEYVDKLLEKGDTIKAAETIQTMIDSNIYVYEPYIDVVFKAGNKKYAIAFLENYLYGPERQDETLYERFSDAGEPIIQCMLLLASYYMYYGNDKCINTLNNAWALCRNEETSADINLQRSLNGAGYDGVGYEVEIMCAMGSYYLQHSEYEKGYEWYQMAFDRTAEFFNDYAAKWSEASILEQWDNRNWIFYEIEGLSKYVKDYPALASLIPKASTAIKGFSMYLEKDIKDCYSHYHIQAEPLLRRTNNNQKKIESLFYNPTANEIHISELEADNDALKVKMKEIVGTKNISILKSFDFDPSALANTLSPSEIFVDFFKVFSYEADSIVLQNEDYKIIRRKPVCNLYCSVLRKGWNYPKIVFLRDDYNIYVDNTSNRLCDYLEQNTPNQINTIYTSQSLSDRIWNEIIDIANIKEGETINFIPTGIYSELAIESLPCRLGGTMQDHYDIHRFSSIREIKHEPLLCDKNDDCLLVGGLDYGSGLYGELRSSVDNIVRGAVGLPELQGTLQEINHIAKLIRNHKVLKGKYGTEDSFLRLDGQSPRLMHIATHGLSKEYAKEEEKEYLFGKRYGRYIGNEEERMYLTGLFLSPSEKGLPTEGILTSKEISMMDLSNTKLVVLSACSTGRGTITDNGVFGLQRGLKMAGVGAVILTFWDVPDETTTSLMSRFWDFWSTGKYSLNQSLNKAKQEMRAKHPYEPYLWNAFVILDGI